MGSAADDVQQKLTPDEGSDVKSASRRVPFHELAEGRSEVLIEFDGQLYRLRVTRNGKLILNK